MKNTLRVIISGGGTGGHIFPAIAIADAIKAIDPSTKILFVGAEGRMEMQCVPDEGYEIKGLPVCGFDRKNLLKNVKVLWKAWKSRIMAGKILKQFRPNVVVGVGGYASGPILDRAASMGIPCLIQEQNSYAGITNKLLAKKVDIICVAYDGMEKFFPKEKIKKIGNPVRKNFISNNITKEQAIENLYLQKDKKTIFITGGSLGARTLNESVMAHLSEIKEARDVQFIWQTGKVYSEEIKCRLKEKGKPKNLFVYDFITNIFVAYKASDLVISRAGAGTITELGILGKATILVPSPNVAEDHQTKNAMALVNQQAAICISDKRAMEVLISTAIMTVKDDQQIRRMEQNIRKTAVSNAAESIAQEVIRLSLKR